MKDEVIILDSYGQEKSEYKRKRKREICQGIAESVVDGEMITEDGFIISSPVPIISDRIIREKRAINIFVDEDFYRRDDRQERNASVQDEPRGVFLHMVKHFENDYDELGRIFAEAENIEAKIKWLFCAYRICQSFWKSIGVNMQEMAGLPEIIDFQELLQEKFSFEDDLTSDFVKIIHREARNWIIIPKNQRKGTGNEILYTEDFIWMPVEVLKTMFLNYGILGQRYQFLEELRKKIALLQTIRICPEKSRWRASCIFRRCATQDRICPGKFRRRARGMKLINFIGSFFIVPGRWILWNWERRI